jgi:hypothetical protein
MFKFEEVITKEDSAILYGVANGVKFDKSTINLQLYIARKNKYK